MLVLRIKIVYAQKYESINTLRNFDLKYIAL